MGSYCSPTGALNGMTGPCYASFANDGNMNTVAVGACDNAYNGPQILTITRNVPTQVDEVVIYNRQDCCQSRLNNAAVVVYNYGVVTWQTVVPPTSALSYTFYSCKPPTGLFSLNCIPFRDATEPFAAAAAAAATVNFCFC